MSGTRFDAAVQGIALKRNGGRKTVNDLFVVLIADHDDRIEQHEETLELLATHCAEDCVRDERVTAIEAWRIESARSCIERTTAIVRMEHEERHAAHMAADHAPRRSDDPEDADFRERRGYALSPEVARQTWLMWMLTTWVGRVLTALLIMVSGGTLMLFVNYAADQLFHP